MFVRSTQSMSRLALALAIVFGAAGAGYDVAAQTAPTVPEASATSAAPLRPLTAELGYRILVGDIALQRGAPALAARAYYEAARDARDAQLARRATEVALFARQRDLALEASK